MRQCGIVVVFDDLGRRFAPQSVVYETNAGISREKKKETYLQFNPTMIDIKLLAGRLKMYFNK